MLFGFDGRRKVKCVLTRIERNHWHPGFLGAMELEFRKYRKALIFDDEHSLSKEPLKMDLLIIRKDKSVSITNQIGEIFREHNIWEYKSPDDGLTIDDYFKTVGYAYLYKGLGKTVNGISGEELTVSLARDIHPDQLFSALVKSGGTIDQKYPGVYYINGVVKIPTQVIVTGELDKETHTSFRVLTKRLSEEDAEKFIRMAGSFTEPGDKHNVDAILQLSVSANRDVYEELKRRDPSMCEALRDLMKEEIQEDNQKAVDIALITVIKNQMKKLGWDANRTMENMGISEKDQIRYVTML